MKTINTLLLSAALAGLPATASARSSLTDGLLAYYPFNGNENDESGNGNHASFSGAVLTADRFGALNKAFQFNEAGDHMSASVASMPLGNAPRSVVAWIKPDRGGHPINGVIDYGNGDCTGLMFGISHDKSENDNLGFWGGCLDYASSLITPADQWSFVALTYDGSSLRLHANGATETTAIGPLNTQNSRLWIGAETLNDGGSFRDFFKGAIDDVRIYNRALSDSEVRQLYHEEGFCSPHRAKATVQVVNGFVIGATITDGGCGYTEAPLVLIQGGGGSGAVAAAVVSSGVVVAINVTNAGSGYTSTPKIEIASPPFVPTLSIAVSKVKVTQNVVLGRNYVLESSRDMANWTAVGPSFTATSESITDEFDVDVTGRFFRIRQVQ